MKKKTWTSELHPNSRKQVFREILVILNIKSNWYCSVDAKLHNITEY